MLLEATSHHPEFYHVPDRSTLAIAKDGRVMDLVRNVILEEVVRFDGYRRVKTISVTGTASQWDSTDAFALTVGAKKNTIQKAVLVNGGSWRNYKVEYLE